MKAESNIAPVVPYDITILGDDAELTFYDNITHIEASGETPAKYTYDEYRLCVRYRDSLIPSIDANVAAWLAAAKSADYAERAVEVREKRKALLSECDWTQTVDAPLSDAQKAAWAAYRQALRDIPEQPGFPYSVEFPKPPEGE